MLGNRNMHPGREERGRDHQGRRMDVSKGQEDTQVLLSCEHGGVGGFT